MTVTSTVMNSGAMHSRNCSVCDCTSLERVFTQATHSITGIGVISHQHQINVCRACGFVLASPLLPEEDILRYYENFSNYELHHSAGELSANQNLSTVRTAGQFLRLFKCLT
jgi:hypothetical protein